MSPRSRAPSRESSSAVSVTSTSYVPVRLPVGARRDVISAALGGGEGQLAVVARAVVVVRRARNEIAVSIVDTAQVGDRLASRHP